MEVLENFNLRDFNSYRINATCKKAYFPESEHDFIEIFKNNPNHNLIIIGNGNNIILSKAYYEQSFVVLNKCFNKIVIFNNEIEAESGATIYDLSLQALENELTGMEFYYDIPSSVGGAVVMNAGTKEGVTNTILLKVRYLDLSDLKIKEIDNQNIQFEYRNSFFQKNKNTVVLKAWFALSKGTKSKINQVMQDSKQRRWEKQPREYPNCGSVFKRPNGHFVGPMIQDLGLKGFCIGDAEVSTKHAGFIVNKGDATGKDILSLIQHIQEKVYQKFKVKLEVEQRII